MRQNQAATSVWPWAFRVQGTRLVCNGSLQIRVLEPRYQLHTLGLAAHCEDTCRMVGFGVSLSRLIRRLISNVGQIGKILNDHELDCNLNDIDAESPAAGVPTAAHGPFAVFRLVSINDNLQGCQSSQDAVTDKTHTETGLDFANSSTDSFSPSVVDTITAEWPEIPSPHTSYAGASTPYSNAPFNDVAQTDFSSSMSSLLAQTTRRLCQLPTPVVDEAISGEEECGQLSHISSEQNLHSYLVDPFSMSTEVRYLLNHYVNNVVDVMTAVNTPKSPWKSIHLPRTLQGSGELALLGSTSHARNALLHALLAISAFNLVAHHSRATQEQQAQNWRAIALNCQARAVTCLKACLKPDCPMSKRGKYKEVLAAMLSMVTINVSHLIFKLYETIHAHNIIGVLWGYTIVGVASKRSRELYPHVPA